MPYPQDHKQQTRNRIVRSAAAVQPKGLRRGHDWRDHDSRCAHVWRVLLPLHQQGGALCGSREAFSAKGGARELAKKRTCKPLQARPALARSVVDAYLSHEHLDDVDGSCPLIGLSSDELTAVKLSRQRIGRSPSPMIQVFKANMKGRTAREQAMVLVALCVRGMVLARALDDQVLAHDFLGTARKHVQKATGWGDRRAH